MRYFKKKCAIRRYGVSIFFTATALLLTSSASAEGGRGAEIRQPVVWQLEEGADQGLSSEYRQALAEALHAVANEAGVVICFDYGAASTDSAFEPICRDEYEKKIKTQGLRFNTGVRVESQHAIDIAIVTLTLSIESTRKPKHLPGALMMSAEARAFAPPEYSPARKEALLAKGIYDSVVRLPPLRDWFVSMDRYPRLLIERPPGAYPPAESSKYALAESPPEAETAKRWYESRDQIVDLLIEAEPAEAKGHADALLTEPIPDELRRRVQELRDKAVTKIAEMTPAPEPEPEPPPPPPPPPPAPEPLDVSFTVRVAQPGTGFRSAIKGRLRISDRDIRFRPSDSKHGNGWSISWWSLKSFGKATGLWDVAHPLVIETKDGTKYFLAEVTKKGVYGRGDEILKYIDQGRKRI